MPAPKGLLNTTGRRYNPITRAFVKEFRQETGIQITYEQFRDIVWHTCQLMQDEVTDGDSGVQLPERLGHLVVTKYKSRTTPKDWKNSNSLSKEVPILNLHSFGFVYHIKWFKTGTIFQNRFIYKFKPIRPFTRKVASNIKKGKKYHKWDNIDFWGFTRMDRMLEKFCNKNNTAT